MSAKVRLNTFAGGVVVGVGVGVGVGVVVGVAVEVQPAIVTRTSAIIHRIPSNLPLFNVRLLLFLG